MQRRLLSRTIGDSYQLLPLTFRGSHAFEPFGQLLIGAAHAGGGIAGAGDGTYAFESRLGGGIGLPIGTAIALRLLQADYQVTTFNNGSNNHQNNLLLGAGVVFHWVHNSEPKADK